MTFAVRAVFFFGFGIEASKAIGPAHIAHRERLVAFEHQLVQRAAALLLRLEVRSGAFGSAAIPTNSPGQRRSRPAQSVEPSAGSPW